MGEFDIIQRYFTQSTIPRNDVILSLGDDCALVKGSPNQHIAITTDTMVEHTHFLPTIPPQALAHKAVMSNLSDLASMGAVPAWISLAITLPCINHTWLKAFSQHLFGMLSQHNIALIGGDTTKGALHTVTITAQGLLPKGEALCRSQGKVGDYIFVSGTLGDSRGGLACLQHHPNPIFPPNALIFGEDFLHHRHFYPEARLALGQYLRQQGFSRCAVDISDGLLADLGHILQKSHCHAVLDVDKLPISPALREYFPQEAESYALTGGEDYELCFTVPQEKIDEFLNVAQSPTFPTPVTCIGQLTLWRDDKPSITLQRNGLNIPLPLSQGFAHF